MNKIKYISSLLIIALLMFSCDSLFEDELRDYQEYKGNDYGILPITSDIVNGFFDSFNPNETSIGFTVDVIESGGAKAASGDVLVNYNGGSSISVASISSFPFTGTFKMSDLASALGINISTISIGDVFTFSYNIVDALGNTTTAGGAYRLGVAVSCKSTLGGISYTYTTEGGAGTTTGSGVITEIKTNEFAFSDFSFGQRLAAFGCCPSSSGVSFFDVCGKLSFNPNNNFDGNSAHSWSSVSVNGDELTIIWSETFTNGTTVLKTTDGSNWPDLSL